MGSKERESKGYAWAVAAGFTAALAAISAKFFSSQLVKYGLVIAFNVTMWGCYVNSLRALSSLQATVTNFATNFLSSGLAGFFLFGETLSAKLPSIHSQSGAINQILLPNFALALAPLVSNMLQKACVDSAFGKEDEHQTAYKSSCYALCHALLCL
uniref:Uncharacterized protein n=1 Tax=Chenopodium quinoa TaxID=63459 RepID=A0A803LKB1_CHEQI